MGEHTSDKRALRVLFVCTGNTCRSPMAEGLIRKLLTEYRGKTPAIAVASAGTMAAGGMPATPLAVAVAEEYGVDIHDHRSQPLTLAMLDDADLILVMASEHADFCLRGGVSPGKLFLLRAFPDHTGDIDQFSIRDPIGGDLEEYQRAFFQIEEALRRSLPAILQMAAGLAGGQTPRDVT